MSGRYLTDLSLLACGVNWLSYGPNPGRGGETRKTGCLGRQQIDAGLRPDFFKRAENIDRFTLRETPCHDKRAKGGAEQHFCGAAVLNNGGLPSL